jgi:hypothetical protein
MNTFPPPPFGLAAYDLGLAPPSEEQKKRAAWDAAKAVFGSSEIRIDCDGRSINWSEYGRYSEYGWQLDHVLPIALGGSDSLSNLRARHWRGNSLAGGLLGQLIR